MKTTVLLAMSLMALQVSAPPPGRGQAGMPPRPTAPGAISGRVTDSDGNPIEGLVVRAMRPVNLNNVLQLATFGEAATTDADGRYRLANRQPGDYFIAAFPYVSDRSVSPTGISIRRTPAAVPGPDGRLMGYVITFFPGVPIEREAERVTVGTDERSGIDFRMARRPVFTLRGRVEGGIGRIIGGAVAVVVAPARVADQMGSVNSRFVRLDDDGRFEAADLPEGEYVLSYRFRSTWADARTTVGGAAPAEVVLVPRPDQVVTGRYEFVGTTAPPTIPAPSTAPPPFMAELRPATMSAGASFSAWPFQQNGTFSARGSGPGPLVLRARAPAPWVQVAGFINGVDTLDVPYTGDAGATDALIVLADRPSSLFVNVRDEIDRPAAGATVIVFSEDSRYWGGRSRRVRLAELTSGGTTTFNDIPPGKYFLLAGRDFGPARVISPAFLESLKPRALPIEIAAAASRTVTLRIN